jgi:hypothetical protein
MLSQVGIGTEPKNGRPAKFGLSQGATTDTMVPGNYRGHFEQPHGSRLEGQHCRCEQLLESPDR